MTECFEYLVSWRAQGGIKGHSDVKMQYPLIPDDLPKTLEVIGEMNKINKEKIVVSGLMLYPCRGCEQAFCRLWARIKSGRW